MHVYVHMYVRIYTQVYMCVYAYAFVFVYVYIALSGFRSMPSVICYIAIEGAINSPDIKKVLFKIALVA